MRRPCRRPRPEAPPPFGSRVTSTRDRAPRRPRPPGNPPALSPATLLCQRGDVAGNGGIVVVENPTVADEDLCDTATRRGAGGERQTRPETSLRPGMARSDPLMHSGRWVPVEYNLGKEVPWTGYWTCCGNKTAFTTHCPDFEARAHQREADYVRDSAEQLNRARQSLAAKFREEWEQKWNAASSLPNDGANCSIEQQHHQGNQHPGKGKSIGLDDQSKRQRPFLRPRWLEFLRQSAANAAASTATGHQVIAPSITGTSASGPTIPKKSAASTRVQKDHARSVIHLALSEARINAFVVIGCLEGLLSVAMEGMKPGAKEFSSPHFLDSLANNDDSEGHGRKENTCTNTNRHGPSSNSVSARTEYVTTKNKGGSDNATVGAGSREESGAALCVRLGALPAVLGCLEEHAGHKEIEPLAARLLSLYAGDRATSGAIRGNSAVAAACTSRMFPAVVAHIAGDAKGTGLHSSDESESNSLSMSSPTTPDKPASSGEDVSRHSQAQELPLNEAVATPAALTTRRAVHLPATDVVYVLSVAVQDSAACQRLVTQSGGIPAMSATLRQQISEVECEASTRGNVANVCIEGGGDARLAEMCLRVMEGLGQPERGRRRLVREGAVETAIAIIGRFRSDDGVLAASTGLLLLLSDSPKGRGRILKAGGVFVVFEAVQRLVGNGSVQVKGAEMLQTLINEEPQARHELNSIKGGWQWLCQGTSGGNALVRYAPGEKNIPGWTVSEEEKLTTQEALATAEMAASDWTPHNLATFMGTMRSQHKLQIGNLAYYHFFRVVSEAGLLPHAHEDVQDWRDRLRRYEDERHIRVGNITRRRLARDRSGAHARSVGSSSASVTR